MPDSTQAQVESNKNPPPTQTYGRATMYATLPKSESSVNSSDSGKYVPPPEPVILPPSKPLSTPYSESELTQYYTIHPTKEIPNLSDVNAVKGNEAVYNYVKSQPQQMADVLVSSKSEYVDTPPYKDVSGLVNIYAGTETKNGVTTETTITPEVSFDNPKTETITSKTDYFRKNDTLSKLGLASIVEAPAFIGLAFGSLVADLTGKEVLGVKPGTSDTREQRVSLALQQRIGETPLDQLMQGDIELKGYSLPEKLIGLAGAGAGLYFTGGGNLKSDLGSLVSRISKSSLSPTSKIASLIARSMQEEKLIMSNPEKVTNSIIELHQGVPPSGVSSVKYSDLTGLNPTVERLPSGQVKATKPEPPSYFKPTTQETGIGSKGQPIKIETENIIEINKAQEGEAKIPFASINLEEKSFTLLRGEGVSKLEPTHYLTEVQGGGKLTPLEEAGLAVNLGAEKYEFKNNIFKYEATPLTKSLIAKNLNPGVKKMPLLLQGTHLFKFSLESNPKNIGMKIAVTKEPDIIKNGRLPEAERPNVIETLIMKHPSSVKYVPPKPFKPKTNSESKPKQERFDIERYPLMSSHEKTSHAETILKSFTKSESSTNKPLESMIRGNKSESSLEMFSYPKETESKFLTSFKSNSDIVQTSQKANKITILTEREDTITKTRHLSGVEVLSKNISDTLNIHKQSERSLTNLTSKSELSYKEDTINEVLLTSKQDLTSKQTTDQTQKLLTTQETIPQNPPPPPEKPPRGFIPLIPEVKKYQKKLKKRKGKEVNFLGNAPVDDVVGLTRRADITYGNKITAGLVKKDISNTVHKKESKFNLYQKLSVNKTTSKKIRPFSTNKTKNEFTKPQKKVKF